MASNLPNQYIHGTRFIFNLDKHAWQTVRALGIGFWLTDVGQLHARMEKLARVQYLSEKDPKIVHCILCLSVYKLHTSTMGA